MSAVFLFLLHSLYIESYILSNNSRETPIARPNVGAMGVFREILNGPKFNLRI